MMRTMLRGLVAVAVTILAMAWGTPGASAAGAPGPPHLVLAYTYDNGFRPALCAGTVVEHGPRCRGYSVGRA